MSDDSGDFKFKVVFVGDSTVGKTSLIHRFIHLDPAVASTTGATSSRAETTVDGKHVVLNVWDTAGQESFRNLVPIYARGSQAAIIVFDQSKKLSFEHVKDWFDYLKEQVGEEIIICIASNKIDLPAEVDMREALTWAAEHNAELIRTSALEGTNVETLFETVSKLLVEKAIADQKANPPPPPKPKEESSSRIVKVTEEDDDMETTDCCGKKKPKK